MPTPPAFSPLPPRDGVAASCLVLPDGQWPSLLDFLCQRFPHVAHSWAQRLANGRVWDQHGQPLAADAPYRRGQRLWYFREVADEVVVPFAMDILYRDAHLLVVDKPHFLAAVPGGRHVQETALTRVRRLPGLAEAVPIHRLDRETAGVMVFCLDPASRGAYQRLFAQREVVKVYEAIGRWQPQLAQPCVHRSRLVELPATFVMSEVPGAANSETQIRLLARRGAWAHYQLQPLTGKKHQLRAHLAALGAGIAHDPWYPVWQAPKAVDDFSRPLALLARSIAFTDPVSGQPRFFASQRQLDWPQEAAL